MVPAERRHLEKAEPARRIIRHPRTMRVPAIWLVSLNVFMVYIVCCGLTYLPPGHVACPSPWSAPMASSTVFPEDPWRPDRRLPGRQRVPQRQPLYPLGLPCALAGDGRDRGLPTGPGFIFPAMAATLSCSSSSACAACSGPPMSEIGIPSNITGSAFGLGCLIGYAPGMFAYMVCKPS